MKRRHFTFALALTLILTTLLVLRNLGEVVNPTFPGDAGARVENAHRLLVGGGRAWLPVLQFHIYLVGKLGGYALWYKFIPFGWTIITLFALSLLIRRLFDDTSIAIAATIGAVILYSFFTIPIIEWITVHCYQEIIALGLFCVLINRWVEGKMYSLQSYLLVCLGLLTRELFWIYLVVFISLEFFSERPKKLYPWIFLLCVPVLWIYLFGHDWTDTQFGNFTDTQLELQQRIKNVFYLPYAGIILLSIFFYLSIGLLSRRARTIRGDRLFQYSLFATFSSLLSFGYIIVFDPWKLTPDNSRMTLPFLVLLPVWTTLTLDVIRAWKKPQQISALVLGLALLIFPAHLGFSVSPFTVSRSELYAKVPELTANLNSSEICTVHMDFWTYAPKLLGAFLPNHPRVLKENQPLDGCKAIVSLREDEPLGDGWQKILLRNWNGALVSVYLKDIPVPQSSHQLS